MVWDLCVGAFFQLWQQCCAVTCFWFLNAANEDDRLSRVLANTEQMMAIFPAIALASNPFQSAPSLSNHEAKQKAFDFKLRLLVYYFNVQPPGLPPPGLPIPQQVQHPPSFTMQCMISKLFLDSSIVEAAHILPKASSRVSFMWQLCCETETHVTHIMFAVGGLCFGYC